MSPLNLCTIVQFYPEDGPLEPMFELLSELKAKGVVFEVSQCKSCGHYDWYIDTDLKGPLSAKEIEEQIQLAGLEYELVVANEDE